MTEKRDRYEELKKDCKFEVLGNRPGVPIPIMTEPTEEFLEFYNNGDRKRAKEIKKRLDILAGALLPVLCKGDSAIERYKEILKKEDIPFILFEEKDNEVQNKDWVWKRNSFWKW